MVAENSVGMVDGKARGGMRGRGVLGRQRLMAWTAARTFEQEVRSGGLCGVGHAGGMLVRKGGSSVE